ncbi:MAG: PKD domain-containing protein [Tahibacter sp.]
MYRTRIVVHGLLGLLWASMSSAQAGSAPGPLSQRIATPASINIPCEQSPFGEAAPMIRDLEPLFLIDTDHGKLLEEWRPSLADELPPLQRVFRSDVDTAALSGKSVRWAANADLNGDGREEAVIVASNGNDVRVSVYQRSSGLAPAPQLVDTWTFAETEDGGGSIDAASIDGAVGDFDGSRDKQREIALSWRIVSGVHATDTRVVVLKGDSAAHIAQADNATAGNWRAGYGSILPRLAAGDFLLSGRDQLALVNHRTTPFSLSIDLIEFNDSSDGTPATAALPNVGFNMRSKHFLNELKDGAGLPYFADDNGSGQYVAPAATFSGQSVGGVEALYADGGDVIDSAAAELVVHALFMASDDSIFGRAYQRALGQRLLHFDSPRDLSNTIVDVSLGNPGAGVAGQSYDSSRVVELYGPTQTNSMNLAPPAPSIAATVADIDGIRGREIVTARAGRPPNAALPEGGVQWWAHKVQVRLRSSYQYRNQGSNTNNQSIVAFTNHSRGSIATYEWNFGDGTPHSGEMSPVHIYTTTGNKTVTLTVTTPSGPNSQGSTSYSSTVAVTGGFDNTPQGAAPPPYAYRIDPAHTVEGHDEGSVFMANSQLTVASGDVNRDGLPEIVLAARDKIDGIYRYVWRRAPSGGFVFDKTADAPGGVIGLQMMLSDFDGDSLNAVLSDTVGDCRHVTDRQLRSMTWMPPYFNVLQRDGYRVASFGKSTTGSSSIEERSGSYVASSFSATVGFGFEINVPIAAVRIGEFEMTSTLSYGLQSERGATHGYETGYAIDQGFSMGDNGHIEQEGVITTEQDSSDCYTYHVITASGVLPNSTLRACEMSPGGRTQAAYGPLEWNTLDGEPEPVVVPLHWVPAQRDWSSIALFRSPAAGSQLGANSIGFSATHGADKATDGLFTTAAETDQSYNAPYLEIDLGEVRDIMAVRIFPSADPLLETPMLTPIAFRKSVTELRGFRLYTSPLPFAGAGTPTAAAATTIVPGGVSTFVQDYGNESVDSVWNVWAANPGQFSGDPAARTPLQARYLRLQKPTSGKLRIAEIQVFADTHSEPPQYPQGVCDERLGDGLFKAQVYDAVHHVAKTIDVRGDMIWSGAVDQASPDTGVPGCVNDVTFSLNSPEVVSQWPIWQGEQIVGTGNHNWNLSQDSATSQGTYRSIENNFSAGLEVQASAFGVIGGYGFELGGGVTQEHASSMTWGEGFNVGGNLTGFTGYTECAYFPRPYAFRETETSNAGFQHAMYVTDYVVRQPANGWQRGNVPPGCRDEASNNLIFAQGFE